jgi:Transposase
VLVWRQRWRTGDRLILGRKSGSSAWVPARLLSLPGPSNPNSRLGDTGQRFQQIQPAGLASGGRVASPLGIDVSKDKLDIAVRPSQQLFSTNRDAAGLDALVARLTPLSPAAVAVEATGGIETVVAASLAAAGGAAVVSGGGGLSAVVVNPAQVRSFAQALGKRAKTDPIDACVIAHFAAAVKPEIRPLPDEAARLLQRGSRMSGRRNRTKMFHVKHFGTIDEAKIRMASYIRRLEMGAIARNSCGIVLSGCGTSRGAQAFTLSALYGTLRASRRLLLPKYPHV